MKKILFLMFGMIFLIGVVSAFDWTNSTTSYLRCNESTGKLLDSTGNNIHGFVAGDLPTRTTGIAIEDGYGQDFDGTLDWVGMGDRNEIDDGVFTVNFWINPDTWNNNYQMVSKNVVGNSGFRLFEKSGNIILFEIQENANEYSMTTTAKVGLNAWNMITILRRANNTAEVYINGTRAGYNGATTYLGNSVNMTIGGLAGSLNINGQYDEIGIWDRDLNASEISELWNDGDGLGYGESPGETEITINLTNPSNNSVQTETTIYLNATYNISTNDYNWTNATYWLWYSNGTILNNSHTEIITGTQNSTGVAFLNISIGKYVWDIYACYQNTTTAVCNWSDNGNFTFTRGGNFTSYVYNSSILETAKGYFSVDLEIPSGTSIQAGSGKLIYNGTSYSSVTVISNGGTNYTISKNIYIPARISGFDTENRTFFWNITIVDTGSGETFVQSSSTQTHQINELYFGLCDSITYLIPVLNFTMIDEDTGIEINGSANATTFQASFTFGGNYNFLNKTYSINNLSGTASTFDFCTANYTAPFYSDMEAFYTAAGYVDKQYFLNNATLTNTTNEINLYLLDEDNALEFFISVEQDLDPVADATINIEKYFVGEGIYKTVEIDETDSNGEFTAYLDLDKKYRFTITKDGIVLGIINKRATCDAAPCEILLSLESTSDNPFANFDTAFAQNVLYNLSFNPNTKMVTFDFIDTTGLATYFRMVVYNSKTNQSSIVLYDTSTYSSSGQMTFNVTGYSGDFYVETYISRSPEVLIDFITFVINALAEQLGLIGLFTSLILILVVIFSLAMKPSMLVMAVPLALTTFKLMGFISLSSTSIVFIYILAFIALFALSK